MNNSAFRVFQASITRRLLAGEIDFGQASRLLREVVEAERQPHDPVDCLLESHGWERCPQKT